MKVKINEEQKEYEVLCLNLRDINWIKVFFFGTKPYIYDLTLLELKSGDITYMRIGSIHQINDTNDLKEFIEEWRERK